MVRFAHAGKPMPVVIEEFTFAAADPKRRAEGQAALGAWHCRPCFRVDDVVSSVSRGSGCGRHGSPHGLAERRPFTDPLGRDGSRSVRGVAQEATFAARLPAEPFILIEP